MGMFDHVVGILRRVITLFVVVDVSGSMSGDKIGTVNSTMEEVISSIREISEINTDLLIKIAVLKFSKGACWVMPEGVNKPIDVREYEWEHLEAKGITDFGAACRELNAKMSDNEFLTETEGTYPPVIILLSDGEPTDDYCLGLELLQHNKWYNSATKVAIAVGNDVNVQVLEEFTGKAENVVSVYDKDTLREWLKFVAETSVKVGSSRTIIQNKNDALTSAILTKKAQSSAEATNIEQAIPVQAADEPVPQVEPIPMQAADEPVTTVEPIPVQATPVQNIITPQESKGINKSGEEEDTDDFIW